MTTCRVVASGAAVALLAVLLASAAALPEAPSLQQGASIRLDGQSGILTILETLPYVESEYTKRFQFDSTDNPKLKELREGNKLADVIAPGKDEFDQQVLLLDWVHNRFKKFGRPSSDARGALAILKANDEGHTFFCAHYADVLVSATASLGWIGRSLALRRPDKLGDGATEHSVTEIWSNQHRKWVMFDPTFALYLERMGVPLNAYELRQEWFYRDGRDLDFVIGKERQRYRKADLPILRKRFAGFGDLSLTATALHMFAFIGYIPNTNLMDAGPDYGKMFIVQDQLCEGTRWHQRQRPADPARDPYFPVNQAALRLIAMGDHLRVELQTLTPNFQTNQVRIDGGEWKPAGAVFDWKLRSGVNRLEARTVNRSGVTGPVSTAEVKVGDETGQQSPYAAWKHGVPADADFFPIAVWLQSPGAADRYRAAGFNLYVGLWKGPTEQQLAELKKHGIRVICAQNEVGLKHKDDSTIVGWMHGDEPDNAQARGDGKGYGPPIAPAQIVDDYQKLKAADPSRPILLNLGQGVAWDNYIGRGVRRNHPEDYAEYVKGCDLVSFDIYPACHENREVAGKLWFVADGVSRLRKWSDDRRVVWNCIECTHISNPSTKATPQQVKAEVWMSLVRGSRGLIYFVHQFKPKFIEAALFADEAMLAKVTEINQQIQRLAPVLNSPTVPNGVVVESSSKDVPIEATVRRHGGAVYVFAVGMRDGQATGGFTLSGLKGRAKAEVVGEGRTLDVQDGVFRDTFAPWDVHLYRITSE